MITPRRSADRGQFDHGWLRTAHTFSFADYHDPHHMQFQSLRVLNEDHIAGGAGFPMHPHRDMEILTWILAGELRHEDDMGHSAVIRPGDVQIMSAGTGVVHGEWNASTSVPVHLLQVWIMPNQRGLPPRYDQRAIERSVLQGKLATLAAPPGELALVPIHQDVHILATNLAPAQRAVLALRPGRSAWVQVARGAINVMGTALAAGDGAAITDETAIELVGAGDGLAEALVFDLA
jgi:quercetin 2,3-dioxygenase